jgi:hypothetical protein
MMQPGHISLPNGLGLHHPDHGTVGVASNDLTSCTTATRSPAPPGTNTSPPA